MPRFVCNFNIIFVSNITNDIGYAHVEVLYFEVC
jgi:hypothetical protein